MNTSDEQLISNIQSTGSDADMDVLVSRHLPTVWKLSYQLLLSNAAADDVTQEVFMSVVRNLGSFRGDAQFTTWLYRITINAARNYQRKQPQNEQTAEKQLQIDNQNLADHRLGNQPDQKIMHTELTNEIDAAISQLSTKLRSAIVLTSIQQLSPREAASIEGCSTATMHWRIHQARRQLKQQLDKYLQS